MHAAGVEGGGCLFFLIFFFEFSCFFSLLYPQPIYSFNPFLLFFGEGLILDRNSQRAIKSKRTNLLAIQGINSNIAKSGRNLESF